MNVASVIGSIVCLSGLPPLVGCTCFFIVLEVIETEECYKGLSRALGAFCWDEKLNAFRDYLKKNLLSASHHPALSAHSEAHHKRAV